MDCLIALLGLLVLGPLVGVVALLLKFDSPGPVFYKQTRIGRMGVPFTLWKIRSMHTAAEESGVQWAAQDDPRITRLGRWLRRWRMDELPQLINVLKGEMSLVGPRPERPAFVKKLRGAIPYYDLRHTLRPGITGWAQIKFRYGASIQDAHVKLQYDLYYLKNLSLALDFRILLTDDTSCALGCRSALESRVIFNPDVDGDDVTAELLLSFHVEEHFHAVAFDSPMRRRHWDQCESRVEKNVAKLLDILAEHGVTATFFVLGWIAERHRGLVRLIAREGHEIASHGYAHEIVTAQTTNQFREDIKKTKQILEDLTGQPVLGYRAPGCSLTSETYWALPIIVDEGYTYDSSLCRLPKESVRYAQCSRLDFSSGSLWEIPLYSLKIAGVALPADGFSMRLLRYPMLKRALKSAKANYESVRAAARVGVRSRPTTNERPFAGAF